MSISEYQQKYSVGSFKFVNSFTESNHEEAQQSMRVALKSIIYTSLTTWLNFTANIKLINEINRDDVDTHDANLLFTVLQEMKFRQNERTPSEGAPQKIHYS